MSLFWTLNSILLIYMPILMPVPHCLNYYSFVVSFENQEMEFYVFVFVFSNLATLGPLQFYKNIKFSLPISIKKQARGLIENALNLHKTLRYNNC